MGRTVVLAGAGTVLCIHFQHRRLSIPDHALGHHTDMSNLGACHMLGLFYHKGTAGRLDHTLITDLATHGAVERCLIRNDRAAHTIGQYFCNGIFQTIVIIFFFIGIYLCHRNDLCFALQAVITDEF